MPGPGGWRRLAELAESFSAGALRARGLRFGLGYLRGSEVRRQFYCELMLHYDYERGLVDLGARDRSVRELVARALGVSRRPVERGWVRVPLVAEVLGVPVIASPDAMLVSGNSVEAVVKASESRSKRIYPSDEAVARLHLYMLRSLGFDVSGARYYYVKAPAELLGEVLAELKEGRAPAPAGGAYVYTFAYDERRCRDLLSRALAYWKMLRDPEPSPSPARCGGCPHSAACPHAARPA